MINLKKPVVKLSHCSKSTDHVRKYVCVHFHNQIRAQFHKHIWGHVCVHFYKHVCAVLIRVDQFRFFENFKLPHVACAQGGV